MKMDGARRKLLSLSLAVVLSAGCTSSAGSNASRDATRGGDLISAAAQSAQPCETDGPLKALRSERMSADNLYDYPLGAGDVLQIHAAELPELDNVTVRVDGDGRIDLPLLGVLQVGGLSDDQVRRLLDANARKVQKEPRIHIFVRHFAARNVYVMGMVAQPGSYPLDSPDESLLGVLGRAGGVKGLGNEDAAGMVVLFPARAGTAPVASHQLMAQTCAQAVDVSASHALAGCPSAATLQQIAMSGVQANGANAESIIIDLSNPTMASCLDMPARPGDVIVIPASGQVGVYGWVARPGSFSISPGMTVLGAVAAAGGAMFSSNAEVKRIQHGTRVSIPVDLSKVEKGSEDDVTVRAGDVVLVRASALGAVPYAGYEIFNKLGAGLTFVPAAF